MEATNEAQKKQCNAYPYFAISLRFFSAIAAISSGARFF
jgi:hypothetical protein